MEYFKDGFQVLKKNLYIFLTLAIVFSFEAIMIRKPGLSILAGLSTLFISLPFSVSVPSFLNSKPKNLNEIISISKENLKRVIGWALLGVLLFIVILVILGIVFKTKSISNSLNIYRIIAPFVLPLFSFWTIFFSIEKKGVIESLSRSLKFSIKNLRFVYLTVPYFLLNFAASFIFQKQITESTAISISYRLITTFFGFLITCSFYLFYKKNYKS